MVSAASYTHPEPLAIVINMTEIVIGALGGSSAMAPLCPVGDLHCLVCNTLASVVRNSDFDEPPGPWHVLVIASIEWLFQMFPGSIRPCASRTMHSKLQGSHDCTAGMM